LERTLSQSQPLRARPVDYVPADLAERILRDWRWQALIPQRTRADRRRLLGFDLPVVAGELPIVRWHVGLTSQPDDAIRCGFEASGQILEPIDQLGVD